MSSTTRPSARKTTRSAWLAATGSWVTMTIVWPFSSTERRRKDSTSSAGARVEVAGRLVGEDDLGARDQGAGDGDPLLLPAGELARAGARSRSPSPTTSTMRSSQAWSGVRPARRIGSAMFSAAVSVGSRLNCWNTKPTRSRRSRVSCLLLQGGQVGVADPDRAAGRGVQAGDDVHQGRLAGAGRAHDGGELAGGELDVHAVEGVHGVVAAAVGLAQAGRPDGGGRGSGARCGDGGGGVAGALADMRSPGLGRPRRGGGVVVHTTVVAGYRRDEPAGQRAGGWCQHPLPSQAVGRRAPALRRRRPGPPDVAVHRAQQQLADVEDLDVLAGRRRPASSR